MSKIPGISSTRSMRTLGIAGIVMGIGVMIQQHNAEAVRESRSLPPSHSMMPTLVTVPDVRHLTLLQAVQRLQDVGVFVTANHVAAESVRDGGSTALVVDESPVPGASISSRSTVDLKTDAG